MKIVIVGCGKVGRNIAEELVKEDHDIVVIDPNATLVESVSSALDVMGVIGNGASLNVLEEAGVENADILLAVTSSDEINMLCCLFAKKAGKKCRTIARVRNPIYNREISYIKDELGLAMVINPEMISAKEISRLLRFPNALRVDSFIHGMMEMITFAVDDNQNLVDKTIMEITSSSRRNILFVGIERGEEAIIPNGHTVIKNGDKISIISNPAEASAFFNKVGLVEHDVSNCMIAGGSTIAYYLARDLIEHGLDVCIIDKDENRCEELADLLPKASIINGYASDDNLLLEEGLNDTDGFVSLTGVDEENVLLSMYARLNSKAKVVTKVNHISYDSVIRQLNVGSLISPKALTANSIISYVRSLNHSSGNEVVTMHRLLNNKAEALSFRIKENSEVVGKAFEQMDLKDNLLIAGIIRNGKAITPSGKDMLMKGDFVTIVTSHKGISTIEEIVK